MTATDIAPAPPAPGPGSDPDRDDVVADGRPRLRRRFGPRSLLGRMVSGVVVLVVVLVLVIGTSTFVLLRQFLYTQLDNQLASVTSQVTALARTRSFLSECAEITLQGASCTLNDDPGGASGDTRVPSPQTEWITLIDSHGANYPPVVNSRFGDLVPMRVSGAAAATVLASNGPVSITTTDGARLRVTTVPIGDTGLFAVAGLSTNGVDRTLGRLLLLELSIGAGAVAVALLASYGGVSFGLKGLRRVTNTAQEVTAELSSTGTGLDRRVPVDAGTDAEVGQLATSVNTLLGAVEAQFAARIRSEERMREFLADASHELRTPLTSIRGFAELSRMQRRQAAVQAGLDPAAAAQDDALDRIESEGTRMSKLVDDLLLLARSDHGAPAARERVVVAEMVTDVVDSARVAHPDRPIDAAVPPGLAVLGDRDQLLRVVRNLVTNAAVHTAPGGPILVSAHADGEEVVIQVADSGPGLPPDQAAHVFDRFWRADKARTRVRGGSGLGMSIVATIVERHQGAVRFDSTPETGSTVTVVLPAAPPGS